MNRALVVAATIVTLTAGECELDQAIVTAVPPATLHVITVSQCGAMKCWERWVETDGVKIGRARACSSESNHGDRFEAVPPTSP